MSTHRKIKNILILAGGDSGRFWPLDNKILWKFLGMPLIIHILKQLDKYGDNIYIIGNPNNIDLIQEVVLQYGYSNRVKVLMQNSKMEGQAGTVDSVQNVVNGELLIVNASDYLDFSVLEKITTELHRERRIVLFGKKYPDYFPGGYFKFNESNKVVEIIEKPGKDNMPSDVVKLVLDYFSDSSILFEYLSSTLSDKDDIYEQALNRILKHAGYDNDYHVYEGEFVSLKYPWHVLTMMKTFLGSINAQSIASSARISQKAEIIGNVHVGENVVIGDYVKIVGPTFIDDNVFIGDFSLIRESHIGKECLVGSYTDVTRAYIGDKVALHRNYVGDSVLGNNVFCGAFAVTGNLRFDGKTVHSVVGDSLIDSYLPKLGAIIGHNSKIGINTSFFPGVKVGRNTWIWPGEKVSHDIPDNMFFKDGNAISNTKQS